MECDSLVFLLQYIIILQLTVCTIVVECVCEKIFEIRMPHDLQWESKTCSCLKKIKFHLVFSVDLC